MKKTFASSGNRTRAARVAGEHSTTEPTMPSYYKANFFLEHSILSMIIFQNYHSLKYEPKVSINILCFES